MALSEEQFLQLTIYFSLLLRWNEKINLTSVRRPEDIAVRHFEESLFLVKVLGEAGSAAQARAPSTAGVSVPLLVDVGSGAGFPGLPVKIALPAMNAVLLEPTTKKH